LIRLARMRVEEEGPAAGIGLYAQILDIRPLPGIDALDGVIEELSGVVDAVEGVGGLVEPLVAFTEALESEVPRSGSAETHDRYGRCLGTFGGAAERAGDTADAVLIHELAVRVYRGLAAFSRVYREPLGSALAALAASATPRRGGKKGDPG